MSSAGLRNSETWLRYKQSDLDNLAWIQRNQIKLLKTRMKSTIMFTRISNYRSQNFVDRISTNIGQPSRAGSIIVIVLSWKMSPALSASAGCTTRTLAKRMIKIKWVTVSLWISSYEFFLDRRPNHQIEFNYCHAVRSRIGISLHCSN